MGKPYMAMIGMDVMGSNFAANFAEKGFDIALFNRTQAKTTAAYETHRNTPYGSRMHPVIGDRDDISEIRKLVDVVGKDGVYFVMVKADDPEAALGDVNGRPTQAIIDVLQQNLEPGAVIVDCANSYWRDTARRNIQFEGTRIHFFGTGVSGGEEGARYGPAIMPGGASREVYDSRIKEALEAVSAKASQDGAPCVTYIGKGGAGHFVKMVHNGIEYGDMELIAEAYDFMRKGLLMEAEEIGDVFAKWNEGRLKSYLIEITAEILHEKDSSGDGYLVDHILDRAMMKGTGTWMNLDALRLEGGVFPIPTIYAAVESRAISAMKDERVEMARTLHFLASHKLDQVKSNNDIEGNVIKYEFIKYIEQALFLAKVSSYTQGIGLMQAAAKKYDFGGLDIAEIARVWRNGCIIRAEFLGDITGAYRNDPDLPNLMAAKQFRKTMFEDMCGLEIICSRATEARVPIMAFDASKNFILQLASGRLPANLTQGQRDYFGAHTYEREGEDGSYHTLWPEKGDKRVEVRKK